MRELIVPSGKFPTYHDQTWFTTSLPFSLSSALFTSWLIKMPLIQFSHPNIAQTGISLPYFPCSAYMLCSHLHFSPATRHFRPLELAAAWARILPVSPAAPLAGAPRRGVRPSVTVPLSRLANRKTDHTAQPPELERSAWYRSLWDRPFTRRGRVSAACGPALARSGGGGGGGGGGRRDGGGSGPSAAPRMSVPQLRRRESRLWAVAGAAVDSGTRGSAHRPPPTAHRLCRRGRWGAHLGWHRDYLWLSPGHVPDVRHVS